MGDYSLTSAGSSYMEQLAQDVDSTYVPNPVDSARQQLNGPLFNLSKEFSEHFHDSWSMVKIDQGWTVGATYDEISKQHPNLRPFDQLPDREKIRYVKPVEQSLKAMVAWGWTIEMDSARVINKSQIKRKMSKATIGNYQPMPVDLRNVTLTRQMLNMCEKIAEHTHDVWAKAKKEELDSL